MVIGVPAPDVGVGGATAVRIARKYVPARQAPLDAPTTSESQPRRQFSLGVWCVTSAPPNAMPFCGAILPKVTWNGWSVANVMAQLPMLVSVNAEHDSAMC